MTAIATTFDNWSIGYHKTMAAVATLGQALNQRASIISLPAKLWSVANKFKSVLNTLSSIPNNLQNDDVARFIKQMESLHRSVDQLLVLAAHRGFTNRTLFAASLLSIRKYNNELQDFIETFKLSLDPTLISEIAAGVDEYRRGETVSLESLLGN